MALFALSSAERDTFTAYDCENPTLINKTVISLTQVGSCGPDQLERVNTSVVVLQEQATVSIPYSRCHIRRSIRQTRCAFNSLVHGTPTIVEDRKLLTFGREECLTLASSQEYRVNPSKTVPFPLNERFFKTVTSGGWVTESFACRTVAGPGGHQVIEQTSLEILVESGMAKYAPESGTMAFKDNMFCESKELVCHDKNLGTFAWPPLDPVPCQKRFTILFNQEATIFIHQSEEEAPRTRLVMASNKVTGQMVALVLEESFTTCQGNRLQHTSQDDLFLLFPSKSSGDIGVFGQDQQPFVLQTHLEKLAHNVYVTNFLQTLEIGDRVSSKLCQAMRQRHLLLVGLIAASPASVLPELLGKHEETKGVLVIKGGYAAYVVRCPAVNVTKRLDDTCTQEMPITYRNRSMFADPISFIITPNSSKTACNPVLPPRYKVNGDVFCGGLWRPCTSARLLEVNGLRLRSFPWSVGSIYTKAMIRNYTLQIHGRSAEESMVNDLSFSAVFGTKTSTSFSFLKDVQSVGDGFAANLLLGRLLQVWEAIQIFTYFFYYPYAIILAIVAFAQQVFLEESSFLNSVLLLIDIVIYMFKLPYIAVNELILAVKRQRRRSTCRGRRYFGAGGNNGGDDDDDNDDSRRQSPDNGRGDNGNNGRPDDGTDNRGSTSINVHRNDLGMESGTFLNQLDEQGQYPRLDTNEITTFLPTAPSRNPEVWK